MSPNEAPAIRTQSLHAAATLARYERHVRRLAATWLDMDLYEVVSAEVDAIGRACAGFPELARPWVALLISHAELMHTLLRDGMPAPAAESAAALALHEHLACIDSLARRCLQAAEASRRDTTMTALAGYL
jgi:hypothetical protein